MSTSRLVEVDEIGKAERTVLNQRGTVLSIELHFSSEYKASVAFTEMLAHAKGGARIAVNFTPDA